MEGTNSAGDGILQRIRLRHFSGNLLPELAEPARRVGWFGTHTAGQTAVRSSPLRFQVPEGDRVEGEGPVESMDENLNQTTEYGWRTWWQNARSAASTQLS